MDKRNNKKLILHFDGRNTIFVSDFNSRMTTEKALNSYISGLVWGEVVNNFWQIKHDSLSTKCPNPSLISFYKYMEDATVKSPEDRPRLREKLGRFTQESEPQFEPVFRKNIKSLEWTYEYNKHFTVRGNGDKLYHYILPTFFNTIRVLYYNKREFAIIIRTFGLDIPHILNAIKAFLNGEHPMYPEKLNIKVSSRENILKRDRNNNEYVYEFRIIDEHDVCSTTSELDIYEHWNSIDGVAAVKDDYVYWSENNYNYSTSKPLWINYSSKTSNKTFHHIFFDDCISPKDPYSIVHLRRISKNIQLEKSLILDPSETEKHINVHLVQSELLECIRNENYFIEKIELCEKNFEEMYF